jgi:hypothetical protein
MPEGKLSEDCCSLSPAAISGRRNLSACNFWNLKGKCMVASCSHTAKFILVIILAVFEIVLRERLPIDDISGTSRSMYRICNFVFLAQSSSVKKRVIWKQRLLIEGWACEGTFASGRQMWHVQKPIFDLSVQSSCSISYIYSGICVHYLWHRVAAWCALTSGWAHFLMLQRRRKQEWLALTTTLLEKPEDFAPYKCNKQETKL